MRLLPTLPWTDSYRGRYLYLSALAFIVFALFAAWSWQQIYLSTMETNENIALRTENERKLTGIITRFKRLEVDIYRFSLSPDMVDQVQLNRTIVKLMEETGQLDIELFDELDYEQLNNFMVQIPYLLHTEVLRLIQVRTNSDRWIPAVKMMNEDLKPLADEVLIGLNELISDNDALQLDAMSMQLEYIKLKNIWLSMLSEFRLLAANRMGIFDATSEGINSRVNNIDLYIESLRSKLAHIEWLMTGNEHAFNREVLLQPLVKNINHWIDQHQKVKSVLLQRYWRSDLPILQEIASLTDEFNSTLALLSQEIHRQAIEDIQSLKGHHQAYFYLLLILGVLLAVVSLIVYLYIDRHILRPISSTTHALMQQSKGLSQELTSNSDARESNELIQAFNLMSEQIKLREKHLNFVAYHDALTSLPNRLMFNERLQHAMQLTQRSERQVALMLLDLDRFKLINDTFGHQFGDKLLKLSSERLQSCMRSEDTIARLGGDEFAVILENIRNELEAERIAEKIIALFAEPYQIEEQEIYTSTSIGIAFGPTHSPDSGTLVCFADIAMYQSKNQGRNQYAIFHPSMEESEQSLAHFENQIYKAINNNEFELHFQPQIDSRRPDSHICEALLRWNHPQQGQLMPVEFLPRINNNEILNNITCWVIRHSLNMQQQFLDATGIRPTISINLPISIFEMKQHRQRLNDLLLNEIDTPEKIILEVRENNLVTNVVNTSKILNQLHDHGFHLVLDDFGSGQSALSHLRAFPIDSVKIDREFIKEIGRKDEDTRLVSAIIRISQELNLEAIAEGVETEAQHQFLQQQGCRKFQGYLFAAPLATDDYIDYLLTAKERLTRT